MQQTRYLVSSFSNSTFAIAAWASSKTVDRRLLRANKNTSRHPSADERCAPSRRQPFAQRGGAIRPRRASHQIKQLANRPRLRRHGANKAITIPGIHTCASRSRPHQSALTFAGSGQGSPSWSPRSVSAMELLPPTLIGHGPRKPFSDMRTPSGHPRTRRTGNGMAPDRWPPRAIHMRTQRHPTRPIGFRRRLGNRSSMFRGKPPCSRGRCSTTRTSRRRETPCARSRA
jgi:hypothetical protein